MIHGDRIQRSYPDRQVSELIGMCSSRVRDPAPDAHNWGVPDWREATAYPADPLVTAPPEYRQQATMGFIAEDALRVVLWRWEFLRRTEEYRKDWEKLRGRAVVGSEKYRLSYCFPDPRESRPFPLWFEDMFGLVSDQTPIARMAFDLSLPLEPQLQYAKRTMLRGRDILERHGLLKVKPGSIFERMPKQRRWPDLLRALDARAQKATFGEIGKALCQKAGYDDAAIAGRRLHESALQLQATLTRIRQGLWLDGFTFKKPA